MRYAIGRSELAKFASCEGGKVYSCPISLEEAQRLAEQAIGRYLSIPSESHTLEQLLFPMKQTRGAIGLYSPIPEGFVMGKQDDIILADGDGVSPFRYWHIRILDLHQAESQLAYEAGLRDLLSSINDSS